MFSSVFCFHEIGLLSSSSTSRYVGIVNKSNLIQLSVALEPTKKGVRFFTALYAFNACHLYKYVNYFCSSWISPAFYHQHV